MVSIVESRYAEALYKVAINCDKTNLFVGELQFAKEAILMEKDLLNLLSHPAISIDEKTDVIKNIFAGRVSDEIVGLIILLIKKGRQEIIIKVFDSYFEIVKKENNIVTACITSAITLDDEQKARIKDQLVNTTNKQVELNCRVNESIIGGLKIQIDSFVLDRTIKTKLENIRKAL